MSDAGTDWTWAMSTLRRVVHRLRRHPRLWELSCELQYRAAALAHQIDDPPAGLDQPFDVAQVREHVEAIRRLCDDIIVATEEGNYDRAD